MPKVANLKIPQMACFQWLRKRRNRRIPQVLESMARMKQRWWFSTSVASESRLEINCSLCRSVADASIALRAKSSRSLLASRAVDTELNTVFPRPLTPSRQVHSRHAPSTDVLSELPPTKRFSLPILPPHPVCPLPHKHESPATAFEPAETRQSLTAQFLVVVAPAADALRRRQLSVSSPRKQPGLHVLMRDVVARLDLAIRLADFRQHSFLVRNVRFHRIGDKEIRTAPGNLRQPGEALLGVGFQSYAQGRASCVRHEHTLPRSRA